MEDDDVFINLVVARKNEDAYTSDNEDKVTNINIL